jgi:hypothetical protein
MCKNLDVWKNIQLRLLLLLVFVLPAAFDFSLAKENHTY